MRTQIPSIGDVSTGATRSLSRRLLTWVAYATATAIGAMLPVLAMGQGAPAASPSRTFPAGTQGPTASEIRTANPNEIVTVMVEMQDRPAGLVYADSLRSSALQGGFRNVESMPASARASAVQTAANVAQAQASRIESAQQAILPNLRSVAATGKIVFRAKSAYNGISMPVARGRIAELNRLPGVKKVHILTPEVRTAATSIDFVGGRSAWLKASLANPTGLLGDGVKVAIIDSGLDYLHTNFGGPGTPAAYAAVTDAGPVPNAYFPSVKVPGGYDFAGDAYDGGQPPGTGFDAVPDANPLDSSNGHGTAVASLIGGLGVNADGSTYTGAYNGATDLAGLKIAPGFAPNAQLYPLRVFGVSGSTNLVVQALEWTLDPNGDGNIADRMDVVNMSLGSPNGHPDNPSAVATANVAAAGVVVVTSAGNSGDSYFITGSPGVASGAISVAASFNNQGGYFHNASVTANSPVAIAGLKALALYGDTSPRPGAGGLTGNVVYANPPLANGPLTNAAAITGNIALVDRGSANFSVKVTNAINAGAVAVIIVNNVAGTPPFFVMAMEGVNGIPAVMISQADGNAIKAQLGSGVNVTLRSDSGFVSAATSAADTLPTYSSRGPRTGDGMLKPDITAPAEVVGVASSLRGTEVGSFNGTSSAAPHIAGIMAVLRQLHPTWTAEELRAAAMNTATHDLFTGAGGTGNRLGAGRVGAGRVDVTNAVATNVVAYNETNRGLVSVSFGFVEVPADSTTVLNKSISVVNKGAVDVEYTVSYVDVTPVAGAEFTVGSTPTITVPAGGTVTLPVTLTATGSLLRHVREAAVTGTQATTFGTQPRHWLTEKTGYAVLTPTGGTEPTLRVALHAAPKPVSAMRTEPTVVFPSAATGDFTLGLTGVPVNTGASFPTDIISLAKPFELQFASPLAGTPGAPTDPNRIKHVGVTSDYPAWLAGGAAANTRVTFAVEGFGPASVPSASGSDRRVLIDADRDGTYDYVAYNWVLPNSNVYISVAADPVTLSGFLNEYTNYYTASQRDTNLFASNAVTIPVYATDIGLVAGAGITRFNYKVVTYDVEGNVVDDTGVLVYDLAAPGLDVQAGSTEPYFPTDIPTTTLPVNYNAANFQSNGSLGVLVLHMHNASGNQGEARTPVALSVALAGNGAGAVTSAPAVISCAGTCSSPFLSGSVVTLSQAASAGSVFTGWSGACTGTGSCQVTMDAAKSVTANFALITYAVATAASPTAGGTVTCTPNPVDHGTSTTCTATANAGYTFSAFSGDCTGATCALANVTSAKSVTAAFTLNTYAVTSAANPTVGGTVSCTPNPVDHGSSVTCTATPSTGYGLTGFSGDCTGLTCTIANVTSARSVTANFALGTYAITTTASPTAGGTVTCTPNPVTHGSGSTCTATANAGFSFGAFTGDCTGATCSLANVTGARSVTATFTSHASIPRLGNLSTRGLVFTGDNVMIGGFVIGGSAPKKVLIRARGPSMISAGVSNAMVNPQLQLVSGATVIATNDDFGTAPNLAEIQATGKAPTNALESVILTSLNPGAYTAIVSGVDGGAGVGIVEVFEVDRLDIPLVNISTRGQVQTGNNVMIGGFIVEGDGPKTVLIRARGPSLVPFGITNALANPFLTLASGQTILATNDDFGTAPNLAAIQATGQAPTNALESAILITLNPGAYTAVLSGVDGGMGVGIVEVFALQ